MSAVRVQVEQIGDSLLALMVIGCEIMWQPYLYHRDVVDVSRQGAGRTNR